MLKDEIVKHTLNALELSRVTYGDIKVGQYWHEHVATKDGIVEAMESNESMGYGIRVVKNGRWGFAASNELSKEAIHRTVKKAVELAMAASKVEGDDVVLTKEKVVKDSYTTPYKEDPFSVS